MNNYELLNDPNMESFISTIVNKTILSLKNSYIDNEWMSLKEAEVYVGVSFNTLKKFRVKGLKISEIDGVKRVSKKELDRFMNDHSF